jgi:hypothetical protein
MKKLWILLFTLSGSMISSWLAPKWITWFYQSPVSSGVDCTPALEWAMQILLTAQTVGAVVGLSIGLLFAWWLNQRQLKKTKGGQHE